MTTLIHTFFCLVRCFFNFYTGFYYLLFVNIFLEQNHINGILVNASAGIMQDPLHIVCTKSIVIIKPKNAHKLNYNDMHGHHWNNKLGCRLALHSHVHIYSTWTIIIISQVFDSDSRPKINTFKVNKLVMQQRDLSPN